MPWVSKSEARWGNSPAGRLALGGKSAVREWNDSTDFSHLPEKKSGKLKRAAERARK